MSLDCQPAPPSPLPLSPTGEGFSRARMIGRGSGVNQPAAAAAELSPGHFAAGKPRPVFAAEPLSWYVEERWVSAALFDEETFVGEVIDPCAGIGNVVFSARARGLTAYGSDLVKRAAGIAGGRDFLVDNWRRPHPRPQPHPHPRPLSHPSTSSGRGGEGDYSIVGNPPWGGRLNLLRAFAEAACERAEKVALLAPAHRLAAAGAWLAALPLKRVLFVSPRPAMWPGPIYLRKFAAGESLGNGFQDFVWLIFQRGFRGAPRTGWLRGGAA